MRKWRRSAFSVETALVWWAFNSIRTKDYRGGDGVEMAADEELDVAVETGGGTTGDSGGRGRVGTGGEEGRNRQGGVGAGAGRR